MKVTDQIVNAWHDAISARQDLRAPDIIVLGSSAFGDLRRESADAGRAMLYSSGEFRFNGVLVSTIPLGYDQHSVRVGYLA